jgi:hypothetical protein
MQLSSILVFVTFVVPDSNSLHVLHSVLDSY